MTESLYKGPLRSCACGRPIRGRKHTKCHRCRPRKRWCPGCQLPAKKDNGGLCEECRRLLALTGALYHRDGWHRPDDELLEWLLSYYAHRAELELPLFEPHPLSVYFASCPPRIALPGGDANHPGGLTGGSVM